MIMKFINKYKIIILYNEKNRVKGWDLLMKIELYLFNFFYN